VLIVDRSEDSREVLATALARHGVRTFSASRVDRGLELARQVEPEVVVYDGDTDSADAATVCSEFADRCGTPPERLLILGTLGGGHHFRSGRICRSGIVPKPYHYGPLIRRIEELIGPRR
jgi:DNA-binding response OmpR family regulator